MRAEVLGGLTGSPKTLSPKYFYDRRGSKLFEQITRLEEYYPTETERALLRRWVPVWIGEVEPRSLVELGAGNADKTRVLLDAMDAGDERSLFVPVDVSEDFLAGVARELRVQYPGLDVEPEVADFTEPLDLSVPTPPPTLYALLGSTIGNFEHPEAARLLRQVHSAMDRSDAFLMGVDLRPGPSKSVERLEEAYDDAAGVTAAFNLNVLRVLNRELGTDFDLDRFHHRAVYDTTRHRIEMHLVSEGDQVVHVPDGPEIHFTHGESVRTEISNKYDRPTVESLLNAAGMALRHWREDEEGLYAVLLAGCT